VRSLPPHSSLLLPHGQRLIDRVPQLVDPKGLADHCDRRLAKQLRSRIHLRKPRAEQHRDAGLALAESLKRRSSILARDHQVENHQIERATRCQLVAAFLPRRRTGHLMAGDVQETPHHVEHGFLVVDHQDRAAGGSLGFHNFGRNDGRQRSGRAARKAREEETNARACAL